MVDEQEGQTGHTEMLMSAAETAADMVAVLAGVRSQFVQAGFSEEQAGVGALQFQDYMLTTAADAYRASLPKEEGCGCEG